MLVKGATGVTMSVERLMNRNTAVIAQGLKNKVALLHVHITSWTATFNKQRDSLLIK